MSDQQQPELDEIQKNVLARLKRIEGQIRGVQNMVAQSKECEDILIQVRAVNSALRSTTKQILKRYLRSCFAKSRSADEQEGVKQMDNAAKVLTDFIDG